MGNAGRNEDAQPLQDSAIEITRRELGRGLMAGAAVGLGGSLLFSPSARAALTEEQKASLSKVLIERLLNTRYDLDGTGLLTVYPQEEVWACGGGVLHQAWLLDTTTGLKVDTRSALEETICDLNVHAGIDPGIDLTAVEEIIQKASEVGILDDLNVIYWVLKEKIYVETQGAYDKGVEYFSQWVSQNTAIDTVTKSTVQDLVVDYLSQPATNADSGGWY